MTECAIPQKAEARTYAGWTSQTLGQSYDAIDRLRRELAQPTESGIDESLRRALEAIEEADIELEGIAP